MFRFSRFALSAAISLSVLALSPVRAHAAGSVLYVGDYISNVVHRFDGNTGALITPDPFISKASEGVVGIGNTLIVVRDATIFNPNPVPNAAISRYDATTGAFLGDIASGFKAVGGIGLSPNGQFVYVPDYLASTLSQVRISDGAILNTVSIPGAHTAIVGANGKVYLTAYDQGIGVLSFDADLSNQQTFIPEGQDGLGSASGMTFGKDGNFYAVANTYQGDPGTLFKFSPTGQYLDSVTSPILQFGFGVDQGPDGRFYVASVASLIDPNYVNCIAAIDFGNHTAVPFIVVDATNHLIGPKYLKFSDNFVEAVPEPSAIAFGILAGGSLLGLSIRANRKRKA